jgi:thymidylate kinase
MLRPIVVEFTGTPEAGKTTSMKLVKNMLEEKGLNVGVVAEAAERIYDYLPKDTTDFGIWVIVTTAKELIEQLNKPNDIIIVDRGILDRIFWNLYSYNKGDITLEEKTNRDLLMSNPYMPFKSDILTVLTIPTEESIKRKGKEGRFVTSKNINLYNDCLQQFLRQVNTYSECTEIVQICTLNLDKQEVAKRIFDPIMELVAKRKIIIK